MPLKALALNCTLKSSAATEASSTDKLLSLIAAEFEKHRVDTETVRLADHNVKPGVTSDEGEGDEWPDIRKKILDANILLIGTPIWLGQPSSVCKRALERMDAFLDETDEKGRMVSYGKIAVVAVVGNEDGAHHVSAEVFQPQRRRLHHSGKCGRLLGWRSDGLYQLRRSEKDPGAGKNDDCNACPQCIPCCHPAEELCISG